MQKPKSSLILAAVALLLGGIAWLLWPASAPVVEGTGPVPVQTLAASKSEVDFKLEARKPAEGARTEIEEAPAVTEVVDPESAETIPTDPTGPSLSGRVVDARGLAVVGAEVRVWFGRPTMQGDPAISVPTTGTGQFTADGIDRQFIAIAFHPGMICVQGLRGKLTEDSRCEGLELVLEPAVDLHGRVVRVGGSPLDGARLQLYNGLNSNSTGDVTATPGVTVFQGVAGALLDRQETGLDGRFRFEGVDEGITQLRVEAADHLGKWIRHRPEDGELVITLQEGSRLEGFVLDARGKPAIGAKVSFGDRSSNLGVHRSVTITDELGRFSVSGIETPNQERDNPPFVAALFEGHAVSLIQPAALDGGGQDNVLRLEKAAPLSGRLIDAEGAPVSKARIWLRSERLYERSFENGQPPTWESLFSEFRRTTGPDGTFEFPHRVNGRCNLRIVGPDFARGQELLIPVDPAREKIEVVLNAEAILGVQLTGVVHDADTEEPITSSLEVLSWQRQEVKGILLAGHPDLEMDSAIPGQFRVEGLNEGAYLLEFRAHGYASHRLEERSFMNGVHDLGEIQLTPSGNLRVEVLDENGDPWRDGNLIVEEASGQTLSTYQGEILTGAAWLNGEPVLLQGIPMRPVTLVVQTKGIRWEEPWVDPRTHLGQTLTLTVPRPVVGDLSVLLVDRGALGAGADVFLASLERAIIDEDWTWFEGNKERFFAAMPREKLEVALRRDDTTVATGTVEWLDDKGHYRTSTSVAEGQGSSGEGMPTPDLAWRDLPVGRLELTVRSEAGIEKKVTVEVQHSEEGRAPVVISY